MINSKKHIVFILDFYHPSYSANGICAKKIIDTFKEEYKVTVVVIKATEGLPKHEYFEGYDIIRVETKEHYIRNRYKSVMSGSTGKIQKLFYTGLFRYVQVRRYINAIIKKENIIKILVKTYVQALCQIDNKIDLIIPLCYPFESIVAALQYKRLYNSSVRVLPYLFDNFSASNGLHRTMWNMKLKMKRHIQLERNMMEQSNHILASWDWEQNIKKHFHYFESKVTYVDIPALCEVFSHMDLKYETGNIHCVYTGALNKMIRPPEYTLRIMTKCMESVKNLMFHLYIGGNCETIVDRYVKLSKNSIINHGNVGIDIVHSALIQSNVLISIGNTDIKQIPSKIYEYMASGKPIIHFYQDFKDPVINILNKYPLSCCLSQNEEDFNLNVGKMMKYLEKYSNSDRIDYEIIKTQFKTATPEYSANIINNIINNEYIT